MKNNNNLEANFIDRARDIKAYIIKHNLGTPESVRGCSKLEIIKLEQEYCKQFCMLPMKHRRPAIYENQAKLF